MSFSYDGTTEVLHDVNLAIHPGTMTALVGPSGSGKSTVAKLIAGYWDVTSGSITDVYKRQGDGNPLAFTAGKMGTGAADNRIIAIIQLADKGVAAALFGCLLHRLSLIHIYSDQLPSALPDNPPVLYPLLSCQSERQSVF